jgi:hypothetical protein
LGSQKVQRRLRMPLRDREVAEPMVDVGQPVFDSCETGVRGAVAAS